jgi:hypothetical protein
VRPASGIFDLSVKKESDNASRQFGKGNLNISGGLNGAKNNAPLKFFIL